MKLTTLAAAHAVTVAFAQTHSLPLGLCVQTLDGVTGQPRRKPLARYSAIEGALRLRLACATAVVPQTDGVI